MFQKATGWLGWTPETALSTPISQIEMALNGAVEWHNLKVSGKPSPAKPGIPEPAKAAKSLADFLRSKARKGTRHGES